MLDSEGFLSALEVKNGNEISKITEVNVPGAEFIRIIPNLSKVLVKTDKKVIQFGFKANKFEKVNEI
jgi:hypothetical protein